MSPYNILRMLVTTGAAALAVALFHGVAHARQSLPPADAHAITELLISKYPILSASPGLNVSYFNDHPNPACADHAVLYYHPHSDQRGRKQMLKASCHRPSAAGGSDSQDTASWVCKEVMFRDYVQITGQDFEVRVEGGHSFETIYSMREASAAALREAGHKVPSTLIKIGSYGESDWMVMWGADGGSPSAVVVLSLNEGADPILPDSWSTEVLPSDEPQTEPPKPADVQGDVTIGRIVPSKTSPCPRMRPYPFN